MLEWTSVFGWNGNLWGLIRFEMWVSLELKSVWVWLDLKCGFGWNWRGGKRKLLSFPPAHTHLQRSEAFCFYSYNTAEKCWLLCLLMFDFSLEEMLKWFLNLIEIWTEMKWRVVCWSNSEEPVFAGPWLVEGLRRWPVIGWNRTQTSLRHRLSSGGTARADRGRCRPAEQSDISTHYSRELQGKRVQDED